jgi:hypothetical protein
MAARIKLAVNDCPIEMIDFVADFIKQTTCGMIASLAGAGPVRDLHLTINGEVLEINLNGAGVPVNEFVTRIFRSTFNGMLTPLKGVTQPVQKVDLVIRT